MKVKSCLTLSDPMDCSPPGSSVQGIFQARLLECDAIAFSAARPTDLQLRAGCGYRSEGYQQTNIIPGKCHAWTLPPGASGQGSLLPQKMQILAPGWCLYHRLSWQLTPAPTSGAQVQSLVPRTKILHALGREKACKRDIDYKKL